MSDVPVSLKAIKPYIERWQEIKPRDPIVAYHCRLFALQQAMEKRAEIPKEDMKYILSLMDALEAEKATLGDLEDAGVQVENFGQELFQKADDNDRAGQSDLRTAKAFLAAGHVMESCKQFGELPADLQEKIKYATWRFVEIAKAVKERRTPAPPRGTEPTTPADDDSAGPSAGIPPADPMPPPPSFQDMPAPPAAVDYPPASYPPSDYPPYMGLPPATPSAVPEAPQAGFPSAPPAHVPPTFGGYAAPPGTSARNHTPSHPIASHRIPSHPIASHRNPSQPIATHRNPSQPIASPPLTPSCHPLSSISSFAHSIPPNTRYLTPYTPCYPTRHPIRHPSRHPTRHPTRNRTRHPLSHPLYRGGTCSTCRVVRAVARDDATWLQAG